MDIKNMNLDEIQEELVRINDLMETTGTCSKTDYADAKELLARKKELEASASGNGPNVPNFMVAGGGHQMSNRFDTRGEMFQAMAASVMPSDDYAMIGNFRAGVLDNRLADMRTNYSAAASGGNITSPSEGGFLTGEEMSSELLAGAFATGFLGSRVRRRTLTGPNNRIKFNLYDETNRADGSRYGGVQSFWKGEAIALEESKPKYRQADLELKKLTGLYYATDELTQDAGALQQEIDAAFSSEFGFKIDDAIIRGTGAGQPLGILASGALVSITKESGQADKTINSQNVIKMYSQWLGQRRNGVWIVNRDTFPQLFTMELAVGTGGAPIGLMGTTIADDPFDRIFRMPVLEMEQAATIGDVGDIMLFDPTQYILADKGNIQGAVSIHVRFLNDEVVFRFIYRVDGQPVPASPITPFKGADSLSPIVALAAR